MSSQRPFKKTVLIMIMTAATLMAACSSKTAEPTEQDTQVLEPLKGSSGKLAFAAQTTSKMPYDIFFINMETGNEYQLTESGMSDIAPDLSDDSSLMVFSSNRNESYDIYKMMLPDGDGERLTTSSADETEPRLSPDGTLIAYQSEASGDYDILTMDLNGENGYPPDPGGFRGNPG